MRAIEISKHHSTTFQPPAFALEIHWNLRQLLGYLRTWSAVKRWQQTHDQDPVTSLESEFKRLWGNPERVAPGSLAASFPRRLPRPIGAIMHDELLTLRNLGKTSAQWLHASGIHTADDLRRLGAVSAYHAVKSQRIQRIKSVALRHRRRIA
jgi:hypothetical protein